jgi:UDP-2,3-diacylglucosamine pyrophosphatase LpxH
MDVEFDAMWQTQDIIIISDLHLAAERDTGLFQADKQLAEFLDWVHRELRHCLLVLNGDVLDFLVPAEGEATNDALDLSRAPERSRKVISHHPEVFTALAELIKSPEHDLFFIAGNHDPEINLPVVQFEIEKALSPSRSKRTMRWVLHGLAARMQVGQAVVLIEHGDRYDAWNKIDQDQLRRFSSLLSRGAKSTKPYKHPPGSRLVTNILTDLRQDFPWVDWLKPERQAVIPLLWYVAFDGEKIQRRAEVRSFLNELKNTTLRQIEDAVSAHVNPDSKYWSDRKKEKEKLFAQWISSLESEMIRGVLFGHKDTDDKLRKYIPRFDKVATEDGYFKLSTSDSSFIAVQNHLALGANLVMHGHTHAAKAYAVEHHNGQGLYCNSGTWGLLMSLPREENFPEPIQKEEYWLDYLKWLADKDAWREVRLKGLTAMPKQYADLGPKHIRQRPTFIRVNYDSQTNHTTAALYEWQDSGPRTLSRWTFISTGKRWEQVQ